MFYVILEKDIDTDEVVVHSVFENEEIALITMDQLIDSTMDYAYKMQVVGEAK
jgi:hypothetical protein